jgi:hypothetical protein
LTSVIQINYCSTVTSSAAVGRVDRRFVAAAVVLPGVLALLTGPVLSATSRWSGHDVHDGVCTVVMCNHSGSLTLNSFIGVVVGAGFFVTATSIAMAIGHRLPLERPRFAPMPLTCACAVFAATIFVGPLRPSTPAWITAAATLAGLGVGSLIGHRAAGTLLQLKGMPTTAAPAPPSAERYAISQRSTAVWTGRLPALRATSWLVPVAFIALQWWLVRYGIPVIIAIVATPMTCVAHVLDRANRRLRVTIGPAGMQLRSGLFNHLLQSVELEHIAAASSTEIGHLRAPTGDWYSTSQRLTIATRKGPALRLSLADDTELVISMVNPAEPAGVINSLLDQRATLSVPRDSPWEPPC